MCLDLLPKQSRVTNIHPQEMVLLLKIPPGKNCSISVSPLHAAAQKLHFVLPPCVDVSQRTVDPGRGTLSNPPAPRCHDVPVPFFSLTDKNQSDDKMNPSTNAHLPTWRGRYCSQPPGGFTPCAFILEWCICLTGSALRASRVLVSPLPVSSLGSSVTSLSCCSAVVASGVPGWILPPQHHLPPRLLFQRDS